MIDEDRYWGDKIVRRPSKEIGGNKSELDTPLWSEIPLTVDLVLLLQSSSETLKISLHQMIFSKNAVKSGLSHFKFDNSLTDSYVKCKAVAAVVG